MGSLLCLLSAVAFGLMALFGKLAYDAGVDVGQLLLIRFVIAALLLLPLAAARGALRGLTGCGLAVGLGMGALGYAAQAGLYFSALTMIDASLVALLLCVYPVLVMAGAVALGRERATPRRVGALGAALAGIVLVLGGAAGADLDWLGAVLALGAALTYTCYILVGDRVGERVPPLALSALVCTGAAGTFAVAAALRGTGVPDFRPAGWLWLAALALVSTVAAILLFFAGLARVGPSVAGILILSIAEPVVTVVGAALVFGEALSTGQLLGGLLVLAGVAILQWPARVTTRFRGSALFTGGGTVGHGDPHFTLYAVDTADAGDDGV